MAESTLGKRGRATTVNNREDEDEPRLSKDDMLLWTTKGSKSLDGEWIFDWEDSAADPECRLKVHDYAATRMLNAAVDNGWETEAFVALLTRTTLAQRRQWRSSRADHFGLREVMRMGDEVFEALCAEIGIGRMILLEQVFSTLYKNTEIVVGPELMKAIVKHVSDHQLTDMVEAGVLKFSRRDHVSYIQLWKAVLTELSERKLMCYSLALPLWESEGGPALMQYHDICTLVMDRVHVPPVEDRSRCLLELACTNEFWFDRMIEAMNDACVHRDLSDETCLHRVVSAFEDMDREAIPLESLMAWRKSLMRLSAKMNRDAKALRTSDGVTAHSKLEAMRSKFDNLLNFDRLLSLIDPQSSSTDDMK